MVIDSDNVIPSPQEHLGFEVGEDRKLADWPQIVEYFWELDRASDRVQTREIGKSTEGNPFLLATISSSDNLANLDVYRDILARLADPRKIEDEQEAEALASTGKAVVLVTCSIHATEVGATQMSMLAAHYLATSDDPQVKQILDNLIILLVPSLNPDGLIKVKSWYDSTIGTTYEGVFPPFLYHKYSGHDNNRDWFMFTQQETKLVLEHCLNAWHPQVMYDIHQTRSTGMRMILPPFVDPIGPNVDPIIQSQLTILGTAMAGELTANGKAGVAVNVVYDAYSPSRAYLHYHGGVRVLSEVAGVRIASPVHLDQSHLRPMRGETPNEASWNHPLPWKGGRWSLRDIVEYDFAAVMACLKTVASNKNTWLRNFHKVGSNSVAATHNPYAYVIPDQQRDANTTSELFEILKTADVEIHEASEAFAADGENFPAGSKVVLTNQPYGSFAKTMLEVQRYPDLRQYPGGPPKAPYDVTAHSLPIQMGVDVIEVTSTFSANLRELDEVRPPRGEVTNRRVTNKAFLLRPEANAAAIGVNKLLAGGANVDWARQPIRSERDYYPPGTFIIGAGRATNQAIDTVAVEHSLKIDALDEFPKVESYRLRTPRVGLYRSYVATAEEGWTRYVFDEYGFDHTPVFDKDIREGNLQDRFDCVILPHQTLRHLHSGHNANQYAPEYSGGLGDQGAEGLRRFVEKGGTLITWDGASRYAIQHLGLPVSNTLVGLAHSEFFAPGSLLRVLLDTNHPIAYGMPDPTAVMFVNGPAFDVRQGRVVGKFPLHNPLRSGLLIGGERLFGKSALVSVPIERGQVILMGFRVNFRAQARGTYKILFNSIFFSAAEK